jgi:hypothetical protein
MLCDAGEYILLHSQRPFTTHRKGQAAIERRSHYQHASAEPKRPLSSKPDIEPTRRPSLTTTDILHACTRWIRVHRAATPHAQSVTHITAERAAFRDVKLRICPHWVHRLNH